ncbi:alpha/beta fold hydrolase [Occallatibacter savannae]|uniref:alpha/beta fold hydrolase n=1 Tax=Occallatibacter savannae TaxID=1002691 RepID=UPI001951D754|nr:alpha/beta hydrolase [Occallatibacter savannae]
MADKPMIVLVHGALTDASVWSATASELRNSGFSTIAPAIPLRGLQSDVEYLSAFVDTLEGPFVLVGHSYGGSVISHPRLAKAKLKSLVFVSAFVQDEGETAGELNARWPGSKLTEATTIVRNHPDGQELYLKPEAFAEVYAADLPAEQISTRRGPTSD